MRNLSDVVEIGRQLFATRPYNEAADEVHHLLLEAGATEAEAFAFNEVARAKYPVPLPRFRLFEVFVTRWCNLDCPYCFVHSKVPNQRMTDETATKTIEFILNNCDRVKPLNVVFMGGEPTSRYDLIRRMVLEIVERLAPDQPYRFDITSNGTLLTEEMMAFFAVHNVRVLLSVDGGKQTHDTHRVTNGGKGTFDAIVERLPMFKRYQPYMGTKMTPTPETVSRLLGDVEELVALGFSKIILGPATGVEWRPEELELLQSQIASVLRFRDALHEQGRKHVDIQVGEEASISCDSDNRWGCRAGRTGLAIDYDGSLSPCSKIIGTANQDGGTLNLGDVDRGITERETHLQLNGVIPTTRAHCRACGLNSVCLGGCYAVNFEATGDPFMPAPTGCTVTEAVLRASREYDPASELPTNR